MASQTPAATPTTPAAAPSSSSLLSDPALVPFLSPNFSAKAYLNSTLPPLLPPSSLSPATTSKPRNLEPLAGLSARTTTLLSTLDLQTQRLLTILQTLADEILRLTPRLGYEIELLRSDVLSLSTTLATELRPDIEHFQTSASEDVSAPTTIKAAAAAAAAATAKDTKPDALSKLEMLATVRTRLEDVIRIFGEAMAWPLNDASDGPKPDTNLTTPENVYGVPVPPRTPSPIRTLESSSNSQKNKASANPIERILYLLSCGDLPAAASRIQELKQLAKVFEGTIEGPARAAVVEALEAKVAEEEERKRVLKRQQESRQEVVPGKEEEKRKSDEEAEKADAGGWAGGRDGYYGLISQLSRMRGGMT